MHELLDRLYHPFERVCQSLLTSLRIGLLSLPFGGLSSHCRYLEFAFSLNKVEEWKCVLTSMKVSDSYETLAEGCFAFYIGRRCCEWCFRAGAGAGMEKEVEGARADDGEEDNLASRGSCPA